MSLFKKKKTGIGMYESSGKFSTLQLSQIDLGIIAGLDVSIYAKPEIPYDVMYAVRSYLQAGYSKEDLLKLDKFKDCIK